MPKVKINKDIGQLMSHHAHGTSKKIGVVLHETVSENVPGLSDVNAVAAYLGLGKDGYAVHGITDNDGNIAWAKNHGKDIYWHCAGGPTNDNYMGIEQISRVMLDYTSRVKQIKAWLGMSKEINATAQLLAALSRAWRFPLTDNKGDTSKPGVTTHWEVTRFYQVSGGHTDCWPSTRGGYYPKRAVLARARLYKKLGYSF